MHTLRANGTVLLIDHHPVGASCGHGLDGNGRGNDANVASQNLTSLLKPLLQSRRGHGLFPGAAEGSYRTDYIKLKSRSGRVLSCTIHSPFERFVWAVALQFVAMSALRPFG